MTIKVLIVEDSLIATTILTRILNSSKIIEVVGTATNGIEGLKLIPRLKPDVICTDLHMPKMNGLDFTIEVMAMYPTPILVISASVQAEDTHHVFRLLEAGAVDIFPKPASGKTTDYEHIKQPLINRIKVLSGIKVFRKYRPVTSSTPTVENRVAPEFMSFSKFDHKIKIMAIAASTGGPQAFVEILSQLPSKFSIPIVCVQHISEGFLGGFVHWLNENSRLKVKIASSGEIPQPGKIYFPPEKINLEFDSNRRFSCISNIPVDGHCPSATVMFKSVAKTFGKEAIGILLTGMGKDGATGLLDMANNGAYTIAQDEKTSVVFGMPQEAIKIGAARKILPLTAIAPDVLSLINK